MPDSPTEERWTIERFDCEEETRGRGYMTYTVPEMVPYKDGEWVRFTEAASQVEALQAEVDDWKRVAAEQENRAKLQEDRARALQAEVERRDKALRNLAGEWEWVANADRDRFGAALGQAARELRAVSDIDRSLAFR